MNRQQRRAARVWHPKGHWLYPQLLHVLDYDEKGRPKTVRIAYDEETVGDVVPDERRDKVTMLLVWMPDGQGSIS